MDFTWAALGRLSPEMSAVWLVSTLVVSGALLLGRDPAGPVATRPGFAFVLSGAWVALIASILVFGVLRGHPLAQYNDASTRGASSLWGLAWIPLTLVLLALGVTALVAAFGPSHRGRASSLRWLAAAGVNALSLCCVIQSFPSA